MTQLHEFRPNLWLTELQLADFAVRGAVILGRDRVLIWDTLSHPRDMQPLLPLLAGRSITIVYSHADWDHVWGTAGLPMAEAIIGHDHCLTRFSTDVPVTLRDKQQAEPTEWAEVKLIPPTMTFETELTLDLGDVTVILRHLPGHTEDCIVAFIPEWGILLAGDTLETPLPLLETDSLVAWVTALQQWQNNPQLQIIIPSHGEIAGPELLQHNLTYLQVLLEGHEPTVPSELDDFYREAHQANLKRANIRNQVNRH
jgi:glyoxylase-like metal-dependent hydrolase (beta-lactamase superfamily II)